MLSPGAGMSGDGLNDSQRERDQDPRLRNACAACGHDGTSEDPLVVTTDGSRVHRSHTTNPDSGFYGQRRGTVRAHERQLASGKTVHVRKHQRDVDPAQDDPAARWQARASTASAPPAPEVYCRPCRARHAAPACAPKPGPPKPPLKPKATAKAVAERPALKPKPQRKPRDPLVSHHHAGRLARKAWRHATRGRRGKALALGGLALGEIGAVVTLQGIGLVFATVAAIAGGIAIVAHKSSSSAQ